MLRTIAVAALTGSLIVLAGSAKAQNTGQECAAVEDGGARLACYDSVFRTTTSTPVVEGKGAWQVREETSKITDKTNVYVTVESDQLVPDRFGGRGTPATLIVRCQDDTTSLTIWFGGQFMASSGGFDRVTYRLDKQAAVNDRWEESTNNEFMGLWSGGQSIPLIKQLFSAQNFLVQATPFNESSITLDFKVGGLEHAIAPLRKACGW